MNISTDKDIFEFCFLIDSTCGDLKGTKLLMEYWNKHGKLQYFNLFCEPSKDWIPSPNEIPYLVRIETLLDNFVERFDIFLKSIIVVPKAEEVPADKGPYMNELIGELDGLKHLRFSYQLGSFCEALETKFEKIYSLLEKIEQYVNSQNKTLFETNFKEGKDFLSRSVNYINKSGKFFIKLR